MAGLKKLLVGGAIGAGLGAGVGALAGPALGTLPSLGAAAGARLGFVGGTIPASVSLHREALKTQQLSRALEVQRHQKMMQAMSGAKLKSLGLAALGGGAAGAYLARPKKKEQGDKDAS